MSTFCACVRTVAMAGGDNALSNAEKKLSASGDATKLTKSNSHTGLDRLQQSVTGYFYSNIHSLCLFFSCVCCMALKIDRIIPPLGQLSLLSLRGG